jgi:ribulose-phosphate 3-epimerase
MIPKRKISPSMMCADFLNLKECLDLFEEEGIEYLHIDIMDGHYVPNFALGIGFCRALRSHVSIPLDIHLMIDLVEPAIPVFSEFVGAVISFHPDVTRHPLKVIQDIRDRGGRAGIALDPAVPIESVRHLLPHVQLINVMTVNPGYAGQKLVPGTIEKVEEASSYIRDRGLDLELEVDGNVSWENVPRMLVAGAEVFVAGTSSVFSSEGSLEDNVRRLRRMIGRGS